KYHGLTRAQLCHMAALAALAAQGPFLVVDAAGALRADLPCAARYLRDLEALGMVARVGRTRDRHARLRYVVTERWTALAASAPADDLLRGVCVGCGRGGRDLTIFRRALWCPDCLNDPRRTSAGTCVEAECARCGRRLEVEGERSGSAYLVRGTCYRCRREYRAQGATADAAWAALLAGLADLRARPIPAPGPRSSAPPPPAELHA
ncbi:MAG: hypothetical protein ABFD65_02425, partial [Candidatus Polarisedimenticolia bacterium]